MFHLFGDSVRRMPSQTQFPWQLLGLGILALVLIAVFATLARNTVIDIFSGSDSAQVEPVQIETVKTAPAVTENTPARTESQTSDPRESTLSEANAEYLPLPEIPPELMVEWTVFVGEVELLPQPDNYFGWNNVNNPSSPTEDSVALAQYILPELQPFVGSYREVAQGNIPIILTIIARDGDFLFATILVVDNRKFVEKLVNGKQGEAHTPSVRSTTVTRSYYLISQNGGVTWLPINPTFSGYVGIAVGIQAEGESLKLLVQNNTVHWGIATIDLKNLPR